VLAAFGIAALPAALGRRRFEIMGALLMLLLVGGCCLDSKSRWLRTPGARLAERAFPGAFLALLFLATAALLAPVGVPNAGRLLPAGPLLLDS